MSETKKEKTKCMYCNQPIEKDELGSWVDETDGDGCLQDSYENDVHKPMPKTRREIIGWCAVDSGQILITDPSYFADWKNNKMGDTGLGDYSWSGACATTLTDKRAGQLNFPAGHAGAGVVSRSGLGDGYYPVYATYADLGDWGERVIKLEIVFETDIA